MGRLSAVEVIIGGRDDLGATGAPPLCRRGDPPAIPSDQRIGERIGIGPGLVVVRGIGRGRIAVLDPGPRGGQAQKLQLALALLLGLDADLRVRLGLEAGSQEDGGKAEGGGEADGAGHA